MCLVIILVCLQLHVGSLSYIQNNNTPTSEASAGQSLPSMKSILEQFNRQRSSGGTSVASAGTNEESASAGPRQSTATTTVNVPGTSANQYLPRSWPSEQQQFDSLPATETSAASHASPQSASHPLSRIATTAYAPTSVDFTNAAGQFVPRSSPSTKEQSAPRRRSVATGVTIFDDMFFCRFIVRLLKHEPRYNTMAVFTEKKQGFRITNIKLLVQAWNYYNGGTPETVDEFSAHLYRLQNSEGALISSKHTSGIYQFNVYHDKLNEFLGESHKPFDSNMLAYFDDLANKETVSYPTDSAATSRLGTTQCTPTTSTSFSKSHQDTSAASGGNCSLDDELWQFIVRLLYYRPQFNAMIAMGTMDMEQQGRQVFQIVDFQRLSSAWNYYRGCYISPLQLYTQLRRQESPDGVLIPQADPGNHVFVLNTKNCKVNHILSRPVTRFSDEMVTHFKLLLSQRLPQSASLSKSAATGVMYFDDMFFCQFIVRLLKHEPRYNTMAAFTQKGQGFRITNIKLLIRAWKYYLGGKPETPDEFSAHLSRLQNSYGVLMSGDHTNGIYQFNVYHDKLKEFLGESHKPFDSNMLAYFDALANKETDDALWQFIFRLLHCTQKPRFDGIVREVVHKDKTHRFRITNIQLMTMAWNYYMKLDDKLDGALYDRLHRLKNPANNVLISTDFFTDHEVYAFNTANVDVKTFLVTHVTGCTRPFESDQVAYFDNLISTGSVTTTGTGHTKRA